MIQTIGIIGAGQMGSGIAHVGALSGYDILLTDIEPAKVEAALELIDQNLSRQVRKGLIEAEKKDDALARIKGVTGLDALKIGRAHV